MQRCRACRATLDISHKCRGGLVVVLGSRLRGDFCYLPCVLSGGLASLCLSQEGWNLCAGADRDLVIGWEKVVASAESLWLEGWMTAFSEGRKEGGG